MPPGVKSAVQGQPLIIPSPSGSLTFSVTPPSTFVLYVTAGLQAPVNWQPVGTNGIPVTFQLSEFAGITNPVDYMVTAVWEGSASNTILYYGTDSMSYPFSKTIARGSNCEVHGLLNVPYYFSAAHFTTTNDISPFTEEVSASPAAAILPRTLFFKSNTNRLVMVLGS